MTKCQNNRYNFQQIAEFPTTVLEELRKYGIDVLEKIGVGGFAKVWRGRWKSSDGKYEDIALKLMSKNATPKEREQAKKEIEIHKKLDHPSIVKFVKKYEDDKYYCLILEYCEEKTLEHLIQKRKFSEAEACDIISQVIQAVHYLQDKFILHRDIKPLNILLKKCPCLPHLIVKLADFGLATELVELHQTKHTMLGTPNYMPPEMTRGNHGIKSDVWNIGCVLFAMLTRMPPFKGKRLDDLMSDFKKGKCVIPEFPKSISDEARELLLDLLNINPEERPNINDLSDYPFFKKYLEDIPKCKLHSSKNYDSSRSSSNFILKFSRDSGLGSSNDKKRSNFSAYSDQDISPRVTNYSYECDYKRNHNSRDELNYPAKMWRKESKRSASEERPGRMKDLKKKINPLPTRDDCITKFKRQTSRERSASLEKVNHESNRDLWLKEPSTGSKHHLHYSSPSVNGFDDYHNNSCSCSSCERNEKCKNHCYVQKDNKESWDLKYYSSQRKSSPLFYSSLKDKEKDSENVSSRNAKKLDEKISPLNTFRLSPKRYETKNVVLTILENGFVFLECFQSKGNKKYIFLVLRISCDGLEISVYKPKGDNFVIDKEPIQFPNNPKQFRVYEFCELPECYLKKYCYAKLFIDIIKAKTPKVTFYGNLAKCQMMENCPNPNFCLSFYNNGEKLLKTDDKIYFERSDGKRISVSDGQFLKDSNFDWKLELFVEMMETCKKLKTIMIETFDATDMDVFPAVFGKKPEKSVFANNCKENISPQSPQQLMLSKQFSLSCKSSMLKTQRQSRCHYENHYKRSENEVDFLKNLKYPPEEKRGRIVAEYKDDMQLWIPDPQKKESIYFYDIKNQQRIKVFKGSELNERVERDLEKILSFVLRRKYGSIT